MLMTTMSLMMTMLVTVAVAILVIGVDMTTTNVMVTGRRDHRGLGACCSYQYMALPELALRRGAEARPARSRRMASAEGRRWQSLAQPLVCSS